MRARSIAAVLLCAITSNCLSPRTPDTTEGVYDGGADEIQPALDASALDATAQDSSAAPATVDPSATWFYLSFVASDGAEQYRGAYRGIIQSMLRLGASEARSRSLREGWYVMARVEEALVEGRTPWRGAAPFAEFSVGGEVHLFVSPPIGQLPSAGEHQLGVGDGIVFFPHLGATERFNSDAGIVWTCAGVNDRFLYVTPTNIVHVEAHDPTGGLVEILDVGVAAFRAFLAAEWAVPRNQAQGEVAARCSMLACAIPETCFYGQACVSEVDYAPNAESILGYAPNGQSAE